MEAACSEIESILENELKTCWQDVFSEQFAVLISGSKPSTSDLEQQRQLWWQTIHPSLAAWIHRQAASLCRKRKRSLKPGQTWKASDIPPAELASAQSKVAQAARQWMLVKVLIDADLSKSQEKQIREELWLELAPQVERIAHCYQKSAAKRGYDVDDLIQDASAHFQQVLTRFNPDHPRRAMPATWFDDVIDNLFASAVRPRKSDSLKRGVGGPPEDDASEDPASLAAARDVRDYRRQQEMEDSLRQVDEICGQLVQSGTCPFERVLAFKLYICEGLTYQEVADVMKTRGYQYGTTQMFNFVKEVKTHVLNKFQGDPFTSA